MALAQAILSNNKEIFDYMIEHGFDVNRVTPSNEKVITENNTTNHYLASQAAVMVSDPYYLSVLLSKNVNLAVPTGFISLMGLAILRKQSHSIKTLLDKGVCFTPEQVEDILKIDPFLLIDCLDKVSVNHVYLDKLFATPESSKSLVEKIAPKRSPTLLSQQLSEKRTLSL